MKQRLTRTNARQKLNDTISVLPMALPAALAAFSTVAMVFLVLNNFKGIYIWPLGLLGAATAFILVTANGQIVRAGTNKERRICDSLAIGLVLLWALFNLFFAGQRIYTNRDPAVYAVTGGWLINHNNLHIDKIGVFGEDSKIVSYSAGFGNSLDKKSELFAQGSHLLPALLGLSGRIVGPNLMLRVNVFFGAIALLALYGFTRLLAKPKWAIITTLAFSLTLPLIEFSRITYTEPLALIFTFGGLSLVWAAHKARNNTLWFIAGVTAGAGLLTRFDGILTVATTGIFIACVVVFSSKQNRNKLIRGVLAFSVATAFAGLIAWMDVRQLSSGYYHGQRRFFFEGIKLVIVVILCGVILAMINSKTKFLGRVNQLTKKWRVPLIICCFVVVGLLLVSRPLWHTDYKLKQNRDQSTGYVTQTTTRTYYEHSVEWIVWYLGPGLVLLGGVGLILATLKITESGELVLIAGVSTLSIATLIFLINPNIASDQIWVMRRFLPVVMPGIAAFAALGLEWIDAQKFTSKFGVTSRSVAVLASGIVVVGPVFASLPFASARSYVGQTGQIDTLCKDLPNNAIVLWVGAGTREAIQPTRTFCNVPAAGVSGEFTQATLATAAQNAADAGYTPVLAVFGSDTNLLPARSQEGLAQISVISYGRLEERKNELPRVMNRVSRSLFVGELKNDGSTQGLSN